MEFLQNPTIEGLIWLLGVFVGVGVLLGKVLLPHDKKMSLEYFKTLLRLGTTDVDQARFSLKDACVILKDNLQRYVKAGGKKEDATAVTAARILSEAKDESLSLSEIVTLTEEAEEATESLQANRPGRFRSGGKGKGKDKGKDKATEAEEVAKEVEEEAPAKE